ncbi:unnamed protein product [Linum tenue]|uniref:F-box protein SKIP8 n=1 Tax=Linum tenue TaxID=586396 RepID=A0AAV0KPT7_9ROSI|nr:unnamed protein product [Linum tenue]
MALSGSAVCYKVNSIDIGDITRRPLLSLEKKLHGRHPASGGECRPFLRTTNARQPFCPVAATPASPLRRLSCFRPCRVASGESEGVVRGGESPSTEDEQTLTQDLQTAIEEEDYAQAAKIRDSLKLLQEDSKSAVLAANSRFYNAFRKGDLASMQGLWSKCENVCCVHPGASGVLGYDDVMESWELVWMDYDFPLEIELKNVRVHFRGDMGYVTCVEFIRTKGSSWGAQFVTNVFERVGGCWFICVHHASPVDL